MSSAGAILVVDDEIGICQAIQRALKPEGFQVEFTLEGQTGLERVKEGGIDLVLLDVKMPEISGIDLIGMIHAVDPEMICIMITGYATIEMAVAAIKQGAYDFLTKPFSIDTLLLAVNQGLERRTLAREAERAARAEEEARRLEEERARLEELDRAKKQFIRLVTHELQAPVAAVEYYLRLILDGYVSPEEQPEVLKKCITRTGQERKLIEDLLELGHLEVLESYAVQPLRVEVVLKEVMEECREMIEKKKLDVKLRIGKQLPELEASRDQVKSLWRNLLSNALKYTPEGGQVTVSLDCVGDTLRGSVADTGIGIPAEEQPRVFSEFYRASNAKEVSIPGTGLGLVIVKRIVEGMGGKMSFTSVQGEGTTFQFKIPVSGGRKDSS